MGRQAAVSGGGSGGCSGWSACTQLEARALPRACAALHVERACCQRGGELRKSCRQRLQTRGTSTRRSRGDSALKMASRQASGRRCRLRPCPPRPSMAPCCRCSRLQAGGCPLGCWGESEQGRLTASGVLAVPVSICGAPRGSPPSSAQLPLLWRLPSMPGRSG